MRAMRSTRSRMRGMNPGWFERSVRPQVREAYAELDSLTARDRVHPFHTRRPIATPAPFLSLSGPIPSTLHPPLPWSRKQLTLPRCRSVIYHHHRSQQARGACHRRPASTCSRKGQSESSGEGIAGDSEALCGPDSTSSAHHH